MPSDLLEVEHMDAAIADFDPLSLRFVQKSGPLRQITFTPERFKEVDNNGKDTVLTGTGEKSTTLL